MPPEVKRGFQCDANHHLWKLGALAMAAYWKINLISKSGDPIAGDGEYFASLEALADYLGCDYSGLKKAIAKLLDEGWLVKIDTKNPYKPNLYKVVWHKEWVERKGSGSCFHRQEMVWDGEPQDSLGKELWRATQGQCKWYPSMLTSLRKHLQVEDEVIAREAIRFFQNLDPQPQTKGQWRAAQFKMIKSAKGEGLL